MKIRLLRTLTDGFFMKHFFRSVATFLLMAVAFTSTSCIFESPYEDEFYRTLWESSEVPLGPFPIEGLTLEFLCGQNVSIQTGTDDMTIYGRYEYCQNTTVFQNLILESQGRTITFVDATRSGDILFLRWRIEDSVYPFTTPMHRLNAYK